MSDMDITVILDDLAAGRIDAAEAKNRIDALGTQQAKEPTPEFSTDWPLPPDETSSDDAGAEPPFEPTPPKTEKVNGISKILIRATGRKVKIIPDAAVSTAAAEDVHQVKRSGSTMEIIGDKEFSGVIDALSWVKSVRGMDDVKALGIGKDLTVRVNPALEVDIDLKGCQLMVVDLPHIGKVRLTAGGATITGVRTVYDLLLQMGQASISGRFNEGWSRIRCESGQVTLEVARDSDVVIRADAQVGRVSWEGCEADDGEVTIGTGAAHLDMGVVFGHGIVRLGA